MSDKSPSPSPARSGLRTFLTPGWIITVVLVISFVWLAFTVLAPWQLGKNEVRSARNHLISVANTTPAVPLPDLVGADGVVPQDKEWRKVIVQGHYDPARTAEVRLQSVAGQPAVQALTLFVTDAGTTIVVNRGFITDRGKATPPLPAAPTGEVTLEGLLRKAARPAPEPPDTIDGVVSARVINPHQVAAAWGITGVGEDYLQLGADQPGVLTAIPLPQLESGPYLSYGIQWIAFGILAPAGLLYFILAEIRERRRVAEEQRQLGGSPKRGGSRRGSTAQTLESMFQGTTEEPEPQLESRPADDAPGAPPTPRRRARYGSSRG